MFAQAIPENTKSWSFKEVSETHGKIIRLSDPVCDNWKIV